MDSCTEDNYDDVDDLDDGDGHDDAVNELLKLIADSQEASAVRRRPRHPLRCAALGVGALRILQILPQHR